jgi:beta-lactam-binding protein with PASTA domain
MVTVPDVLLMSEADAKAKLISVGLVPNVTDSLGAMPFGHVIGQLPAAGESVVKGSTVTINVGRPIGP